MSGDEQQTRIDEVSIASILKAYYAFYVSDINGSIPYTQAFQARYGGTLTPTYDAQKDLFDTLDLQIKTAVANLEANPSSFKSKWVQKIRFSVQLPTKPRNG